MFVGYHCMLEIHNFLFDFTGSHSWEFAVSLWETSEFGIFQKSMLELFKLCGLLKLSWMHFAVQDDQVEACSSLNIKCSPQACVTKYCSQCCYRRLWNLWDVGPLMVDLEGYICLWSQSSSLCFLIGHDRWTSAPHCYCHEGLKHLKLCERQKKHFFLFLLSWQCKPTKANWTVGIFMKPSILLASLFQWKGSVLLGESSCLEWTSLQAGFRSGCYGATGQVSLEHGTGSSWLFLAVWS